MRPQGDGLAAVAYAPSAVTTKVNGVAVHARVETDYPFRDRLDFTIAVDNPVEFPFVLRVPQWANAPTLKVGGSTPIELEPGTFYTLQQEWQGSVGITLKLPMQPKTSRRFNDTLAIERGPLVYALHIGEEWRRVHQDAPYRELPHGDWEVYPTTPWNYALDIDATTLSQDITFSEHPMTKCPFSPTGAPISAQVQGRRLPEWDVSHGSAEDAPPSPVSSAEPLETLALIPYGCTNLRITEFPVLERQ
jgi:hypothetical protein